MKLILFIILLSVLLPSCRKGEVPNSSDSNTDENPVEVKFSSGITATVEENPLGRAPIDGESLLVDSNVGIFGIKAKSSNWDNYTITSSAQKNLQNAEYQVYDQGRLYQRYIAEYPTKDSQFDGLVFYGYYPYMSDVMNYYDFWNDTYYVPVSLSKNDMSSTPDYLFTGRINQKTPKDDDFILPLVFKHALARIKFTFNRTTSDVNVDGIVVSADCSVDGKMLISTGETIPDDTSTQLYRYFINKNLNRDERVIADFLLFPGAKVNFIQCIIDSKTYPLYVGTNLDEIKLEQGKVINITINFSPKEANFTGILQGWEDNGENQDVNIEEK